jgi:alkylation response protein AidB-like acyl-CoA dehydrogenase
MRDYSMERIQGNRPIIQHPNVGALVGEGDCLIRTLKNLLYRFAWECDQLEPGELLQENELLYVYYLHYWVKEVTRRVMEIGLEIYAGLGCQKDLPFERWMRLVLLGQHTGSTGTFNLIKSARMIEKMQKMQK